MGGAPEDTKRLLIRESRHVVERATHHFCGHGVIQSLQPHCAVDVVAAAAATTGSDVDVATGSDA